MFFLCSAARSSSKETCLMWSQDKWVTFHPQDTGSGQECSYSVMSDSLWPPGLQPARLLCPWDSPGKNTRVGCHFLFRPRDQTLVSCIAGRSLPSERPEKTTYRKVPTKPRWTGHLAWKQPFGTILPAFLLLPLTPILNPLSLESPVHTLHFPWIFTPSTIQNCNCFPKLFLNSIFRTCIILSWVTFLLDIYLSRTRIFLIGVS